MCVEIYTRAVIALPAAAQRVGERPENVGDGWQEPSVEVQHAQEGLKFLHSRRLRKVHNSRYILREWCDAGGFHPVSKKVDGRHAKNALLCIYHQPMLP